MGSLRIPLLDKITGKLNKSFIPDLSGDYQPVLEPVTTVTATDVLGNWTAWTENGVAHTATYDARGVQLTETVGGVTRTFHYDSAGNLTGVS